MGLHTALKPQTRVNVGKGSTVDSSLTASIYNLETLANTTQAIFVVAEAESYP